MQFSATYLYCPGESVCNSGKGLLRWKAPQINFEKCHLGNCRICTPSESAAPPKFLLSFGKSVAATTITIPRVLFNTMHSKIVCPTIMRTKVYIRQLTH